MRKDLSANFDGTVEALPDGAQFITDREVQACGLLGCILAREGRTVDDLHFAQLDTAIHTLVEVIESLAHAADQGRPPRA